MSDYFTELGDELFAAAERQQTAVASEPAKRGHRISHRAVALGVGVVLLAGVPAAAVTGVFRPHREVDGLVRLTEQRVVASGTTRDGRGWELLSSRSGVGYCVGLRLTAGAGGGSSTSEGCGGKEPGELSLATSSGGDRPKHGLVFGTAPAGAVSVRARARDVSVNVRTVEDPKGQDGRFYFAEMPINRSLGRTTVVALDAAGKEIGRAEL